MKIYVHKKTCKRVFTAAVFIIVKTQKQPKGPGTAEWAFKYGIYNGMLFSGKKKHTIKLQKTWRKLKCLMLSERNQSKKVTHYMISTICHSGKGKTVEAVKTFESED